MSVGDPIHSTGFGAMENKENGPIFSVMPSPRQRSKEFLCEENPVRNPLLLKNVPHLRKVFVIKPLVFRKRGKPPDFYANAESSRFD